MLTKEAHETWDGKRPRIPVRPGLTRRPRSEALQGESGRTEVSHFRALPAPKKTDGVCKPKMSNRYKTASATTSTGKRLLQVTDSPKRAP